MPQMNYTLYINLITLLSGTSEIAVNSSSTILPITIIYHYLRTIIMLYKILLKITI